MPIVTRSPEADPVASWGDAPEMRPGGGHVIGMAAPPPEELLPSGGFPDAPPVPTARDRRFRQAIEQVRRDLAPIRSRRSLLESFARESLHTAAPDGDDGPRGPRRLRVALVRAHRDADAGSAPGCRHVALWNIRSMASAASSAASMAFSSSR